MSRKSLQVESNAFGAAEQALPACLRNRPITSLGSARWRQPAAAPMMRVGFIGLDPIGKAMASRLLKAGHRLTVYDPDREMAEAIESAGGSVANSIQDACRWADAVFTMLPNDVVAEAVVLGHGGVVESLPPNAIHIGSSTISVECSDRIVEAHWDAGRKYVSAPVLVRSEGTAGEQLLVIAGGRGATIIQIAPLIGEFGQVAQLSGWPSDANAVQLASIAGATLFQSLARPAFLDVETQGVLQ